MKGDEGHRVNRQLEEHPVGGARKLVPVVMVYGVPVFPEENSEKEEYVEESKTFDEWDEVISQLEGYSEMVGDPESEDKEYNSIRHGVIEPESETSDKAFSHYIEFVSVYNTVYPSSFERLNKRVRTAMARIGWTAGEADEMWCYPEHAPNHYRLEFTDGEAKLIFEEKIDPNE